MRRGPVLVAVVLLASVGLLAPPPIAAEVGSSRASSCGEWRWPVKTLSHPARRRVNFHPRQTQVAKMRKWNGLGRTLSGTTPRFGFTEFHTWTVKAHPI